MVPTAYAWGAKVAADTIHSILAGPGVQAGHILSINIAALREGHAPRGVRVVRQCTRPWNDTYERRTSPKDGALYFWNNSVFTLGETEEDTDVAALKEGYVTVTPLMFDLTANGQLRTLKSVER